MIRVSTRDRKRAKRAARPRIKVRSIVKVTFGPLVASGVRVQDMRPWGRS